MKTIQYSNQVELMELQQHGKYRARVLWVLITAIIVAGGYRIFAPDEHPYHGAAKVTLIVTAFPFMVFMTCGFMSANKERDLVCGLGDE